jgi:hypothetical protein
MNGEEDLELNRIRQEAVASINGLISVNGLTSVNGLISVNGLTSVNGLRSVNGLVSVNGLRSVNGLLSVNGLSVDCTGKTAGVSCTGEPDGLLDNATGLMSSDAGIATAKYLMRCALPKGDSIRIKDYTGGLVSLSGELGLATAWKDGQCDETCQQKISACLMAFTNGDGAHVEVELAASYTLGTGHTYPYQEAAFYGNLFSPTPKAFYCVGKDYALNGVSIKNLETRACTGYNAQTGGSCPYVRAGYCNNAVSLNLADNTLTGDSKCNFGFGTQTATSCKDTSTSLLAKSWAYPITTFRKVQQ